MKKFIKWHSQHLEFDTLSNKLVEEEDLDYDDEVDEDGEKTVRVLQTPFGNVEISDKYNPLRQFKLWIGHTNFTIGNEVSNKIKRIEGVEIFKPYTRYRFYLGVGDCFEFSEVRRKIEMAVCDFEFTQLKKIEDTIIRDKVDSLIKTFSKNKKWAIYVLPNGKISYTTDESADFDNSLSLYKESEPLSKGVLICNETGTK